MGNKNFQDKPHLLWSGYSSIFYRSNNFFLKIKKTFLFLLNKFLIFLFFILFGLVNVVLSNLLTNSNFETGNLNGWSISGTHNNGVTNEKVYSGNYSAFISTAGPTGMKNLYQNINVYPGKRYNLSGYVYLEGTTNQGCGIGVKNGTGGLTSLTGINFVSNTTITGEWIYLFLSTIVAPGASQYGVNIYLRTNGTLSPWSTAYFDNIIFEIVSPGKITGFVATDGILGGEINLSWIACGYNAYENDLPSGSTFYIQYSSMTEDVVFSTSSPQNVYEIWIPTGPVVQGSYCYYTVGDLEEGATYYFRIWARDNAGNWSEISEGATAQAQITPQPPDSLSVLSLSSTAIKLVWVPSNAKFYRVEHSSVSDSSSWIFISTVSADIGEYIDENLTPNTTCWYRFFGINSAGVVNWASPSNVVSTITYPSVPTNFGITNRTATSIRWSWAAPLGGCDGYRIYYATSPTDVVADLPATETSYEETGLSTNTVYYRFIRAYNIVGESISNYATFYTLAVAPVNLQIVNVYQSSVTLIWELGENPSGTRFGVERAEDENFTVNYTTFVNLTSNLTEVSTTAMGLSGDTTYYFRVFAYNGDGIESGYSNVVSTKTLGNVPLAPVGLYGVALSTVSIKWEWKITPKATYYQVYNQSDNSLLANLEGNGTTTWIETNLSSNTQYTRYVKAGNEYGLSIESGNVSKYTLAYPPSNLTATVISSSAINLEWDYSGATKYQVWYSTDLVNSYLAGSINSPTLSFTHQGLEAGVTYYYRIIPVNGDDEPNDSFNFPIASARTLPSIVVSFSTAGVTATSIIWTWVPAIGADGYKIYRATDNSVVVDLPATETSYEEIGLSTNTAYGMYIRAYNSSGLGELSTKTTVYTLSAQPLDLTITEAKYRSISFSWSANGNPVGTKYEVSMSNDNFLTNFSTPIKLSDNYITTTAEISDLNVNTEYWFRVRAFNEELIPTDFVVVSTRTKSTGNLLNNEFFEEWVITSSHSAQYWSWDGAQANLKRSEYPLVGNYSAEISLILSEKYLSQTGITLVSTKTYYAEVWVRGTGKVRVGIVRGGGGSATYGEQKVLSNDYWTKVTHSRLNNTDGSLGGIRIGVVSKETTGEKIYIGAAWLSDTSPPSDWPTVDTLPPVPISNLTALTGSLEGSVLLTWTSPGDDGMEGKLNNAVYRIRYSTINFSSFTKDDEYNISLSTTGVFPGTEVSYLIVGLKPGTSYYFGIIACDDSGNWSNWLKDVQTNTANCAWALDLPPSPPVQIYTVPSNRKITLSWQHPTDDPGDIDKYWVYQATFSFTNLSDGDVVHISTIVYPTKQVVITQNLRNGTSYYFRIKAVDKSDKGDGFFGDALEGLLSEIVVGMPKISPPTNLVGRHFGNYVELNWTNCDDVEAPNFTGYNIYRSESFDRGYVLVSQVSKVSSFTDNTVEKNKTYYYLVKSSDTDGFESDASNIATVIPDIIPPEIEVEKSLSSRDLGKPLSYIRVKVSDDRFEKGDALGRIMKIEGRCRKIGDTHEMKAKLNPELIVGVSTYVGNVEFDFSIIVIGSEGIEYYISAEDEVNISRYPSDGGWLKVAPPIDKPEQKFITPKNPEMVFGSEVEEVVIRDYFGNEIWKGDSGGGSKIIIWRGEDKNNKKIESGGYIYEIKTKDGKKKFGVAIIVK